MEPYSSANNTENQDEESYYRTPAFGPEDIICPGSDSEETPEETRQKRLRYEEQAQRYLRGYRPVLLSASLRGPFSKESGWINPWNHLRTKDMLGGSHQGQRDVTCRRTGPQRSPLGSVNVNYASTLAWDGRKHDSVRERRKQREVGTSKQSTSIEATSSSKVGYVNPAKVLAWQAKVGATERVFGEEGSFDCDRTKEHAYGDEPVIWSTKNGPIEQAPSSVESKLRPAESMINHYERTPYAKNEADFTRVSKRARDSQWLMGSFNSKRARWDGPALSSPTPGPDSLPSKDRARRFTPGGSPKQQQQFLETDSLGSIAKQSPQTNTLFSAQLENRRMLHSDTPDTGFNSRHINRVCQPNIEGETDELQQAHESKSESRRLSGRMSRKRSNNIRGCSFSDLKQDDSVAITPRAHALETAFGSSLQAKFTSATLPRLPRPDDHDPLELDEDSFVSEVAPSSRNLEQFHFKKRKRRTKSTEYDGSAMGDARLHTANVKHPPDENSPNEEDSCLPNNTSYSGHSIAIHRQNEDDVEISRFDEEVSEVDISMVLEDALDVEGSKHSDSPTNMVSPEDAENSIEDTREQSTGAEECLPQGQANATILSDQQAPSRGKQPSANENEDGGSFNLGDMSFLRAVLRAGGSAHNTPSNPKDVMLVSRKIPMSLGEDNEDTHRLPYLANFSFSTSKHMPSALHQKPPSVHLSSPISTPFTLHEMPSRGPVLEKSQHSLRSSKSEQSSPPKHTQSSSCLHLPQLHVPPEADSQFLNSEEDGSHHSDSLSASMDKSSQHQILPQNHVLSEPSKPSQDLNLNDFSTQSYNTTPFKSQRSVRRSQHTRTPLEKPDLESCDDSDVPNMEQNAMDRIQLQLSQICPSSPQVATTSEDDDSNVAECIKESALEADKPLLTTDAIEPASQQECGNQNGSSPEAPGNDHGLPTTHAEARMDKIELEKLELTLNQPDNHIREHSTHIEANESQNNHLDHSAEELSETSWEGCGPQSPWAVEFIEPILMPVPAREDQVEALVSSEPQNETCLEENNAAELIDNQDTSSEWRRVEESHTPANMSNEPVEEHKTPKELPKPREVISLEALTSTQLLVDAATKNPWMTSLRKPSAVKVTKRVSFGKSSSQDSEDSRPIQVRFGPATPPPQSTEEQPQDEDDPNRPLKGVPAFGGNFNNREFKKILPELVALPAHSSPAVAAQAEAFIAADRKTSIEQEPSTTSTLSRHFKPRRETDSNLVWQQPDETDMLLHSYMRLRRSPSPPASTSVPGFNMEEALGEAGRFLEDWSVDSELKKANKGSDTNTGNESNGYRRRRLFGLV